MTKDSLSVVKACNSKGLFIVEQARQREVRRTNKHCGRFRSHTLAHRVPLQNGPHLEVSTPSRLRSSATPVPIHHPDVRSLQETHCFRAILGSCLCCGEVPSSGVADQERDRRVSDEPREPGDAAHTRKADCYDQVSGRILFKERFDRRRSGGRSRHAERIIVDELSSVRRIPGAPRRGLHDPRARQDQGDPAACTTLEAAGAPPRLAGIAGHGGVTCFGGFSATGAPVRRTRWRLQVAGWRAALPRLSRTPAVTGWSDTASEFFCAQWGQTELPPNEPTHLQPNPTNWRQDQ